MKNENKRISAHDIIRLAVITGSLALALIAYGRMNAQANNKPQLNNTPTSETEIVASRG